MPSVLWLLYDLISLKNDVNVPSQRYYFLLASWRSLTNRSGQDPHPDPYQNVTDPKRYLWWMRYRRFLSVSTKLQNFLIIIFTDFLYERIRNTDLDIFCWTQIRIQAVTVSGSGSRPRFFYDKAIFFYQTVLYVFVNPYKGQRLQEKLPAEQRTLQTWNLHFFLFRNNCFLTGSGFPVWIRIRKPIRIRIQSGSETLQVNKKKFWALYSIVSWSDLDLIYCSLIFAGSASLHMWSSISLATHNADFGKFSLTFVGVVVLLSCLCDQVYQMYLPRTSLKIKSY